MRSIVNSLSRGTTALVIDHHTVHHAMNQLSIHIQERDTTGKTIRGQDIDGVTVEELGSTGDISTAINSAKLLSFVGSVAPGVSVSMDELPPAPKEEVKAEAPVASAP